MDNGPSNESDEPGMGCVLRVRGDNFDVDDLLSRISLSACHVMRKGKPRFGPRSKVAECTGFNVVASEANELNLPKQVADTIGFLKFSEGDLKTVMSYPGVTCAEIDFSVECRIGRNGIVAQNDYLPPELLKLAGNSGIAINLTLYPSKQSEDG